MLMDIISKNKIFSWNCDDGYVSILKNKYEVIKIIKYTRRNRNAECEIMGIFKDKRIVLNVIELGEITQKNSLISSARWVNALCSYEKDVK